MSQTIASPHFSHQLVAKRRKGRPDKARDPQAGTPGPRKRTLEYVSASFHRYGDVC